MADPRFLVPILLLQILSTIMASDRNHDTPMESSSAPARVEETRAPHGQAADLLESPSDEHSSSSSSSSSGISGVEPSPAQAEETRDSAEREAVSALEEPTTSAPGPLQLETSSAAGQEATTEAPQATTASAAEQTTRRGPLECIKDSYCLNGGTCIITESGQMICECPAEFYGTRCQTRNICKTAIVGAQTGEHICQRIGRACLKNDKFFRCECQDDEYFVFRPPDADAAAGARPPSSPFEAADEQQQQQQTQRRQSTFSYDGLSLSPAGGPADTGASSQRADQTAAPDDGQLGYVAECRKMNKCLGVRCRQLSEVCVEGKCQCNRKLGFIEDPSDRLCKLLDPCRMPTPDGRPICGEQAKCVATYDGDLYHCVCPVGYLAVKVNSERSSTQCAAITDLICDVPMLNRCQHLCKIDRMANTYRCSCLPGYKAGARPGLDDHMCFFSEQLDEAEEPGADQADADYSSPDPYFRQHRQRQIKPYDPVGQLPTGGAAQQRRRPAEEDRPGYIYRPYVLSEELAAEQWRAGQEEARPAAKIAYAPEPGTRRYRPLDELEAEQEREQEGRSRDEEEVRGRRPRPRDLIIRRELPAAGSVVAGAEAGHEQASRAAGPSGLPSGVVAADSSLFSAQDRCNMYCEENKICVLEPGSTNSYRCVCDRQGYVSIGDRCLDWCTAAEFSHTVQNSLEKACFSGVCRMTALDLRHRYFGRRVGDSLAGGAARRDSTFGGRQQAEGDDSELLEHQSSWRPSFECDCSSSPVLTKDPATRLCKLDFDQIIRPCLPGNEGYQDCVVNKHSYCTVLHKRLSAFLRDLLAERLLEASAGAGPAASMVAAKEPAQSGGGGGASKQSAPADGATSKSAGGKKLQSFLKAKTEKLYTCVCSPEKKFLVDKPRNKARCINECDLLNVECGRFNRMCRAATVVGDDWFGHSSLVSTERDGAIRMDQFKRTGCECLPGFNVGPSESVDFTLDDNYPAAAGSSSAAANPFADPWAFIQADTERFGVFTGQELKHLRTRYMNINSRCLLDYDVVEFHATFKAPANFEPAWISTNKASGTNKTRPSSLAADDKRQPARQQGARQQAAAGGEAEPEPGEAAAGQQGAHETRWAPTASGRIGTDGRHFCKTSEECRLKMPAFMRADIADFHKHAVLVAQCHHSLASLSFEMYRECTRYRYWIVQKLRHHFADWRRVMTENLKATFDLMEGNIRLRVNKCRATINRIETIQETDEAPLERGAHSPGAVQSDEWPAAPTRTTPSNSLPANQAEPNEPAQGHREAPRTVLARDFDPYDPFALIDADVHCELTIHSASDDSSRRHARKVLLEKQLPKLIFDKPAQRFASGGAGAGYYLMAPNALIQRESFDQLASHRKLFSPCQSDYAYCDRQTRCEMVDTVNFSCTCEYGYTPIGSRDIYFGDSRKEVCEDIDECLFDVCKENGLENKSICVNEIGDYRCQCIRHHVGDNKRYCNHICNVISCKYGDCRIPDEHHAFCECYEGYREADCSVQDPSVALRKANMIICGSIFTSVLLLAITLAISLNSQLKKTKKKLKRLEAAHEAAQLFELSSQQAPFRPRVSKRIQQKKLDRFGQSHPSRNNELQPDACPVPLPNSGVRSRNGTDSSRGHLNLSSFRSERFN